MKEKTVRDPAGQGVVTARVSSPLGGILLQSDGTFLTGLWFEGEKNAPAVTEFVPVGAPEIFEKTELWLREYFSGIIPSFTPPLRLEGTPFMMRVWGILQGIPYGGTRTYKEIAREISAMNGGSAMSAQAVGGAVGRNPVSIIVPCHRVVGAGGALTGYAAGLERKEALLALEKKVLAAKRG